MTLTLPRTLLNLEREISYLSSEPSPVHVPPLAI